MVWCITSVVNTIGFIVLTESGRNFYLRFGTAQSAICIMKFMAEDSHHVPLANLFKIEQTKFSWPFLVSHVVHPEHFSPPLGSLQYFHGFLVLGSPKLDRALHMWCHMWWTEGDNPLNLLATLLQIQLGVWLAHGSTHSPPGHLVPASQSCLSAIWHLACMTAQLCICCCWNLWCCGQPIYPVQVSCTLLSNPAPALTSHSPLCANFWLVHFIPSSWSLIKAFSNTCTVWALALPNPLQHRVFPSRWLNK